MMCFLSVELVVDLIQGFTTFEIDFLYRTMIAMIFAVAQFGFSLWPFEFIKLIAQYMTLIIVILTSIFIFVVMKMDCKDIKGSKKKKKNGGFCRKKERFSLKNLVDLENLCNFATERRR